MKEEVFLQRLSQQMLTLTRISPQKNVLGLNKIVICVGFLVLLSFLMCFYAFPISFPAMDEPYYSRRHNSDKLESVIVLTKFGTLQNYLHDNQFSDIKTTFMNLKCLCNQNNTEDYDVSSGL